MKRSVVGFIIAGVAIFALAAIIGMNSARGKSNNQAATEHQPADTNQQVATDPATANSNEVAIQNFAYGPEKLTVKKGTTVTWTNRDSAGHTVTPDEESAAFKSSELLAQDETYSFTFDEPGTYTYFCEPHPYMKATVEVTE